MELTWIRNPDPTLKKKKTGPNLQEKNLDPTFKKKKPGSATLLTTPKPKTGDRKGAGLLIKWEEEKRQTLRKADKYRVNVLSVLKCTANLYCICFIIDLLYT